jgi:hypothetical protein
VYMSSPCQSPEFNVGDNVCRSIHTVQLIILWRQSLKPFQI